MKKVKDNMKLLMGGCFMVGVIILFFAKGQRLLGIYFIGAGVLLGIILQIFLGEDIIRWRTPKKMKVK